MVFIAAESFLGNSSAEERLSLKQDVDCSTQSSPANLRTSAENGYRQLCKS
jgi:hypothetical protein